jgi:hypothetical protein
MKRGIRRGGTWRLAACLIVSLMGVGRVRAVEVREFIHETQQSSNVGQQLTLVWWLPPEFWEVSMASNPNISAQTSADISATFHDYQVFALVRASTGVGGLTALQSNADLVSNAHFEVAGQPIAPIPPDKVPPGIQTMLGAMRPMLANMLGQLGQSMELVVYPGVVDQHRLIEPLKSGSFQFALYDQTFHWRTPLASLLPKKVDRKTKEEFPGNYDFNPYTGDKLISK